MNDRNLMQRCMLLFKLCLLSLLVVGCAAPVVRSHVTAFHEWPAQLQEKTYVFERSAAQNNNLEYRNYENLVRAELSRLGFSEATVGSAAKLKVTLNYDVKVRDVRVIEPMVIGGYGPGPYFGHPYWRGGYYGPFYDPFWYSPPIVERRDTTYQIFTRELKTVISDFASGKRLHETTVVSEGTNPSLAAVMPTMIRSAFTDFPGPSGVPRRVELKLE